MKNRKINEVFGTNLRTLVDRKKLSVAALCRDLKMNRTQFNRYLGMESWPRPDVLHRICAYFDVDARVLLEPLDQIEGRHRPEIKRAAR